MYLFLYPPSSQAMMYLFLYPPTPPPPPSSQAMMYLFLYLLGKMRIMQKPGPVGGVIDCDCVRTWNVNRKPLKPGLW